MEYNEFEKKLKDKETIIVLDTNVILDLARYSLCTSKNIMKIFAKCSDLIWIPNQVIKEYNKNKHEVFGNLKKRYSNFEDELKKIIVDSKNDVIKNFKITERYNYPGRKKYSADILEKLDKVIAEIANYKNIAGAEYNKTLLYSHEIEQDIEKFVGDLENKNQVGCKIGFKEKMEIIEEGDLRYRYKLPPGFEDDKKEGIEKFGDLFLWKEILKLPSMKKVKNIIFITNDEKDDWWDKEEISKKKNLKKLLNLRSELYEEFTEINPGVSIDFITTKIFQNYASKLYNLFESDVYIELNRDDDSFINRVNKKIKEGIQDDLYTNSECYLGFGIEIVDIEDCTFIRKKNVYQELSDGGTCITYELEYQVELYCHSDEYSDEYLDEYLDEYSDEYSDDDNEYIFAGTVVVSIDRFIEPSELEKNPKYLNEDEEYWDFSIIEDSIEQLD